MGRVLLISANRERFPAPAFPLGLAYMAGVLRRQGHSVRIFDAGLHGFPERALTKSLKSFRPDAVGLSLRNIDNASFPSTRSYIGGYASLLETIRRCTTARVILGGPAFSIFPEDLMRLLGADAGISGEGEAETERFLTGGGDGVFRGRAVAPEDISFPPDIEGIFPRFRNYKTIGVQTARGCPARCIYCTYPVIEGRRVRKRPPGAVAGEMALLSRMFPRRDFFIVDSLFNSDENHMVAVLEEIVRKNLKLSFSCYLRPRAHAPSVFRLLGKAGCIAVDFGTDSGSEEMLRTLRKGFGVDEVITASEACRRAGIEFCHSLLFGAPGESTKTIRQTVGLMDSLAPKAVIAMTGIRLYPGAELAIKAQEEGCIKPGGSLLNPFFYFSDMGPSRLVSEVRGCASGRPNWFFPGERNWSASVGVRLVRMIHRRGPLWLRFKPVGRKYAIETGVSET